MTKQVQLPAQRGRRSRFNAGLMASIFIALGLVTSAQQAAAQAGKVEKPNITFGIFPITNYGIVYLSLQQGFFQAEGLNVTPRVMGANPVATRFSGIRVARYRFLLFALTGLAAGLAAVLLTSRLGSTRPSIAQGWELEIISIVILGGVSVWGGKGSILGVVLAALVFGLVTFGLGLMNIPGIVMSIFTGTLLILVVAVPALLGRR